MVTSNVTPFQAAVNKLYSDMPQVDSGFSSYEGPQRLTLGLAPVNMDTARQSIEAKNQNDLFQSYIQQAYGQGYDDKMAEGAALTPYNPGGPDKYGGKESGYNTPYGLEPDFWDRLRRANAALKAAGLGTFTVSSGHRTYAQQAALYKKKPGLAAPPGKSRHQYGVAVDLNLTAKQRKWLQQNGKQFGLYQPMSYEPWHWQPT